MCAGGRQRPSYRQRFAVCSWSAWILVRFWHDCWEWCMYFHGHGHIVTGHIYYLIRTVPSFLVRDRGWLDVELSWVCALAPKSNDVQRPDKHDDRFQLVVRTSYTYNRQHSYWCQHTHWCSIVHYSTHEIDQTQFLFQLCPVDINICTHP